MQYIEHVQRKSSNQIVRDFQKSSKQAKDYPYEFYIKLEKIKSHIAREDYTSAQANLSSVHSHLLKPYSKDLWKQTSISIEYQQLYKELNKLIGILITKDKEIKSLRKRTWEEIFISKTNQQQEKIAIFDLLSKDQIKDALILAQEKGFNGFLKIIQDLREYRWLLKRDEQIRSSMRKYRQWKKQPQIEFSQENRSIKIKLEQHLENSSEVSFKCLPIIEKYSKQLNFKETFDMIREEEVLHIIFEKNCEHYGYTKWMHKLQDLLIENHKLEKHVIDGQNRFLATFRVVEGMLNDTKKIGSDFTNSTINSEINAEIEISEEQAKKYTFKRKSVYDSFQARLELDETNLELNQKVKHLGRQLEDLRRVLEVARAAQENAKTLLEQEKNTSKQIMKKLENLTSQNRRLLQKQQQVRQSNKLSQKEWNKEILEKQSFEQLLHSFDSSSSRCNELQQSVISKILSQQEWSKVFNQICESNLLKKVQAKVKLVYAQGSKSEQLKNHFNHLKGVYNLAHILIVIRTRENIIISAYFEKGFHSNTQSDIQKFDISVSFIAKSEVNQSIILEDLDEIERAFILVHEKDHRIFVPKKKISLLKIDNSDIQIGNNDMKIELAKGRVKWSIGNPNRSPVFQSNKQEQAKFLPGPDYSAKFQALEIFNFEFNGYS